MRLALLLALSLMTGLVVVGAAPTAAACTSDPAVVCHVIHTLDECGEHANHKEPVATLKRCTP